MLVATICLLLNNAGLQHLTLNIAACTYFTPLRCEVHAFKLLKLGCRSQGDRGTSRSQGDGGTGRLQGDRGTGRLQGDRGTGRLQGDRGTGRLQGDRGTGRSQGLSTLSLNTIVN